MQIRANVPTSRFTTHAAPASRRTKPAVSAVIALAAILILATSAHAQHTATIIWTNSPDTPQTNIYRSAGATLGTPGNRQIARLGGAGNLAYPEERRACALAVASALRSLAPHSDVSH